MMTRRFVTAVGMCAIALWVVSGAGCATNPVTGKRQLSLISEAQEIEMGREADKEVAASFGLYPDEAMQQYVNALGTRIAATTERPNLPWTFRVVDDAAVNAFAIPGGFVYVTRGIMTHLNSEAELAGILGHEIGHVTARHSVSQISKQQLAQVGLAAGMVLSPEFAQFGNLAETAMGLMFLKFSRSDESQADQLGLKYMMAGGYDPRKLVDVFAMLQALSQQSGSGRLPQWMSTHPDPENRQAWATKTVASLQTDLFEAGREAAGVPAAPGRHHVRREPARGVLPGRGVPPPRPGVPDELPAGVEGQQREAGRRRREPQRGCHGGAAAGGGAERAGRRLRSSCRSRASRRERRRAGRLEGFPRRCRRSGSRPREGSCAARRPGSNTRGACSRFSGIPWTRAGASTAR